MFNYNRRFRNQPRGPKRKRVDYRTRNLVKRGGAINPQNRNVLGKTEQTALRQTAGVIRIPRLVFMTDAVLVDLTYPDTTLVKTNSGLPYLSWRYRMNSVFDPDPLVLSGSVPGHTAWSGFFEYYRVVAISYNIDISNLESTGVDVVVCPTLNDLGSNYINTNELFGNPHATVALLSAKGGQDRVRLSGSIDLGTFYGSSQQYLGNDGFNSLVSGNPTVMFYLNVGAIGSAAFSTAGVDYRVSITYTTLYNKRRILIV